MDDMNIAPASQTFYYHWWRFWKALAAACAFAVAGFAGMLIWPPLGFMLLALATASVVGVWLFRAWNSLRFINGNRLVRKRGFLGCAEDVITLFGVISPYQNPLFGRLFDVGSVHLGIPGPDVRINHIANFAEFHRLLVYGAEQQQQAEQQFFQIIIHVPPDAYYRRGHARELPVEQYQRAHFYDDDIRG